MPIIDPPRIKIERASLVPKFPGAIDGIKVNNPNTTPTKLQHQPNLLKF